MTSALLAFSTPLPDSLESGRVQVQEKAAYTPMEKQASGKPSRSPPRVREKNSMVLHGFKLVALIVSLMLALFCVAVDNTILTTAIPSITDDFHSVSNIAWYGSAYLLTTSSCQVLFARFYTYFHVRWVFSTALTLFEIGSLVCATAQGSIAFICGRGGAGLGSAGIFAGCFTIASQATPVHLQPLVTGLLGGIFGFSAIFGPLLGGVLTQKSTWRWCFYLNLPIGAVTTLGIILLLNVAQDLETLNGSLLSKILLFNPIGNLLLFGAVLCLLIALQWGGVVFLGGVKHSWSDGRVIALLTLFAAFVILMVVVQVYNAKSMTFAAFFSFCIGGSVIPVVYFLPVWFQGVKGLGAIQSAVHTLPMILSQLTATISAGVLTGLIGYCMPFFYAASVLIPIGTGLFTTFTVDMPIAK